MWSTEQKRVGDAVLAAVADQQDVGVGELGARSASSAVAPSSSAARLGQLPASQWAPWIAQGTTCSRRQKTARRSPAGS